MTLPLATLQRQFCTWLTEQDEDRASQIAAGLQVGPGLAVYRNTYRVALMDALRQSHPRAAAWLGDVAFEAAAARFIDAHPPSSWTIDAYGAGLPAMLRATDPVAADIAAIDRAVGDAFVAADAVPIEAGALADVDWEQAVIRLVPSFALVPIQTNADALWLALAHDEPLPDAIEAPGTVMVWRQGFEPVMRRAVTIEPLMQRRSLAGVSFAAICEEMAATVSATEAATRAGTALGRWLGEGLIASFA